MQSFETAFDPSCGAATIATPVAAAADGCTADAPRRTRAEQSRINGAKSRGPTTDAGKSVAAQNAWKHGLRARGQLLPDEDPAVFDAFVASFRDDLQAVGPCQVMLAERVAEMAWKLQRMPVVRSAVLCSRRDKKCADDGGFGGMDTLGDVIFELQRADANGGIVMLLQRYEAQIERSMQAALRELRILQGGTRNRGALHGQNDPTADGVPGVTTATEPAPATARSVDPVPGDREDPSAAESRVRLAESHGVATAAVDPDASVDSVPSVVAGVATLVNPVAPTGSATFHPDDLLPADAGSRVRSAEGLRGRTAPVRCDHYGKGRSAARRG
ncbi:hypothetical protein [Humisphaera borealis]|uniref:Uncharacterized protein n=1 Tax=Humisphaera borealis TaxID=2807512 RepID=A0A7M2WTN1_9BACT|nr:hypothetical protein [Humisphaera borealis]QOV88799.1 hypothetical protein IPV69_21630 [Humisphaera borealis]